MNEILWNNHKFAVEGYVAGISREVVYFTQESARTLNFFI